MESPPANPPIAAGTPDCVTGAAAETIRRRLLENGFDRIGFARAGPVEQSERVREWMERGYAGEMAYLARHLERRLDPRHVVPGAQTVIAAALHYRGQEPTSAAPPEPGRAFISSYAQGTDYHRVLEKRLMWSCRDLAARFTGHTFRWYVDTGPVLERSWAQAAGIGWIGKNTCAIDPRRGSYFFIGTIITTLSIPPDAPSLDRCGTCRLCLDACPTAAFVEPYRLDARRCISYLTIENRGPIPEEFRPALDAMVFGCDICQEVCPFNRLDRLGRDPALAPRPENQFPGFAELSEACTEEKFRARFPQSAVRRARFPGFLRNLILAIGNSGAEALLPLLEKLGTGIQAAGLRSGEGMVREALEWARRRLRRGGKGNDPKGI